MERSEGKEPLDYHCFEIWRYTDSSFDLNAKVHDGKFDLEVATIVATMMTRTMREDVRDTRLVYCVELYEDGQAGAHWHKDEDLATNFREYLWAKRTLHRGTYAGLFRFPKMPGWLINCVSTLEYGVAATWGLWVRVTGRDAGYVVRRASEASVGAPPPQPALEPSEELSEGLEGVIERKAGNVVWVRRWGAGGRHSEE